MTRRDRLLNFVAALRFKRCADHAWRRALAVLVVVALVAKAWIPTGFMPEVDAQTHTITITWCSAGGSHPLLPVKLPLDTPSKAPGHPACAYAIGGAPPIAPTIERVEPPASVQRMVAFALVDSHAPAQRNRRAHAPPTGPPAFA